MSSQRMMHLNLFMHGRGHHEAAWRHPAASPLALTDLRYFQDLARRAEAGLFDSIFLADQLAIPDDVANAPRIWLEPITTLAALAASTDRIGLIGTCSTTYTEPYNLARMFASLDHISGGPGRLEHRHLMARDRRQKLRRRSPDRPRRTLRQGRRIHGGRHPALGQLVGPTPSSTTGPPANMPTNPPSAWRPTPGEHYSVTGPLNMPRGPQGRPVFVQAGSSESGRTFAARYAEAVFTAQMEKLTAQEFYQDLKARAATLGRPTDQVIVLPGLCPVIGGTEAEAERAWRELGDLSDVEVGRKRLSGRFGGHDFSHLPLDVPLRRNDFPDPGTVQAARSRTEVIVNLVEREGLTLRRLLSYLAGARGHFVTLGTPEQIADLMEDWFETGAADGFNVMPPVLPAMLDTFIDQVVPILQKRGLFRTAYEGPTLRDQYGLHRPSA